MVGQYATLSTSRHDRKAYRMQALLRLHGKIIERCLEGCEVGARLDVGNGSSGQTVGPRVTIWAIGTVGPGHGLGGK